MHVKIIYRMFHLYKHNFKTAPWPKTMYCLYTEVRNKTYFRCHIVYYKTASISPASNFLWNSEKQGYLHNLRLLQSGQTYTVRLFDRPLNLGQYQQALLTPWLFILWIFPIIWCHYCKFVEIHPYYEYEKFPQPILS